jgi:HEPN domain-containing protein
MKERHEAWFAYAEDDLNFAKVGLREGFHAQVCYHCQQAIEKCLKGLLVFQGKTYPRTHGLMELAKSIPELDLKKWRLSLARIEDYCVPTRYPDAAPGTASSGPPSKEEAAEALKTAGEIFHWVKEIESKKERS